jgi:hypothetical protein
MVPLNVPLDRESIAAVYVNFLPLPDLGTTDTDLFYSEVAPFYTPDLLGIAIDEATLDERARAPAAVADYLLCSGEIDADTHKRLCQALGDLSQQQMVLRTKGIVINAGTAADEVAQGLVAVEIRAKRFKDETGLAA